MSSTVLKIFGTGQVTIPKKWREKRKAKMYFAHEEGEKIVLEPVQNEEVIFDADEFNAGKGVKIDDFVAALENSLK